jgi:hypothetical protein
VKRRSRGLRGKNQWMRKRSERVSGSWQRNGLSGRDCGESFVDQDDNGEVIGEGALGGSTPEKAMCLQLTTCT